MKRKYPVCLAIFSLLCFSGVCGAKEDAGSPAPDGPAVSVQLNDDTTIIVDEIAVAQARKANHSDRRLRAPEPKMSLNNFARTSGKIEANKVDANDTEPKITLDDTSETSESETPDDSELSISESSEDEVSPKAPSPRKVRVLSPEVLKLKDQIQTVLDSNAKRTLSTQGNTPAEIMAYSFVYGADAKMNHLVAPQPQPNQRGPRTLTPTPIYTIGGLCWNYPCNGKTLLRIDGKKVLAKVGPGMQRKPSSLMAMLAMSSIAEKYEIRIGDFTGSVADLVRTEKAYCSDDADMSLTLIGLAFYCDCEEEWTNEFGENWSVPKVVLSELYRPADQGTSNITDQLLGLACAVRRFENEGIELTGAMLDAKRYLISFRDFAIAAQNEQGLWHSRFFLFRGTASNSWESLYSGGHIFRFLAFELPENRLCDAKVVKTAKALTDTVSRTGSTPPTTERQWEALMTSLHALAIYKERLEASQNQ